MTFDPFADLRAKNKVTLARYDRGTITRSECELALCEAAVDLLAATLAEAKKPTASNALGEARRAVRDEAAETPERKKQRLAEFKLVQTEAKFADKANKLMYQVQEDLDRIGAEIARGGSCWCCGKRWVDDPHPHLEHARYCSFAKALVAYNRVEQAVGAGLARFAQPHMRQLARFRDRYQVAEAIENPMTEGAGR